MKITAVCIGKATPIRAKSGMSGIYKRAVLEPVEITEDGLVGDTIVDTKHHGGPEQAVYMMGEPDRARWSADLGRALQPGFFGENLLVQGMVSGSLCIGDILETDHVTLQVTAPRSPCVTLNARADDPGMIRKFNDAGRPGAYARVLKPGHVTDGDSLRLIPYAGPRIPLAMALQINLKTTSDFGLLRRITQVPAHEKMRSTAQARLSGAATRT